jgi:tRNA splicing endonuclease
MNSAAWLALKEKKRTMMRKRQAAKNQRQFEKDMKVFNKAISRGDDVVWFRNHSQFGLSKAVYDELESRGFKIKFGGKELRHGRYLDSSYMLSAL